VVWLVVCWSNCGAVRVVVGRFGRVVWHHTLPTPRPTGLPTTTALFTLDTTLSLSANISRLCGGGAVWKATHTTTTCRHNQPLQEIVNQHRTTSTTSQPLLQHTTLPRAPYFLNCQGSPVTKFHRYRTVLQNIC
jgi:hypothetical protein